MPANVLPKPGTNYGPCNSPCAHKDCFTTRSMAISKCRICGKPIGYDTRYYIEPGDTLVHAVCFRGRNRERKTTIMKSKKLFIVVQEGGSSSEYYVHAHDTIKDANRNRKGCAEASYRASWPIEVPPALAKLLLANEDAESEFLEVLETVLRAPIN